MIFVPMFTVLQKWEKGLVERYHSTIQNQSVDWDKAEYDRDFNRGIEHCCLNPTDICCLP
jgi:hypothetical protein